MKHPFYKMLYKALGNSTVDDNVLLKEAEKIKDKGYRAEEIHTVLVKIRQGLIDDTENEIAAEAVEEFERHID